MKVFLVGGLGFIGRRFIGRFSGTHDLVVYAKKEGVDERSRDFCRGRNVVLEWGSVGDQRLAEAVTRHKPAVVIHLAALTGLEKCNNDPSAAFMTNVFGTHNVVDACVRASSRMVFTSSREVYGTTRGTESGEDDPLRPNNVYGTTKVLGETLVKQSGLTDDLDYTILRLTNVYGPGGDRYGIQTIIKRAISAGEMQIWGGRQRMNLVFVDDVVDLLGTVLEGGRSSGQTFNVGSHDNLSFEDLVARLSGIMGGGHKVTRLPPRYGETMNFVPDLRKAREILGFDAKTRIGEGLKMTVEWYARLMRS